jgi:hypothetical protein
MGELLQDGDSDSEPPRGLPLSSQISDFAPLPAPAPVPKPKPKKSRPKPALVERHPECGLCGERHEIGHCFMTLKSENLKEYRELLILHTDDESWEERVSPLSVGLVMDLMRRIERCD